VLFRRTLMFGADDLYLLDVGSGKERALTNDGWKATGHAWSGDSRHVFFSSNRGGEFGLWSVDIRIDQLPRQMSLGLGTVRFSRISADRNNRLAVELNRGRTNLALLSLSGSVQAVTANSGADGDATVADDGAIAYVSNRSGSQQIWVTRAGGEPVRVTSIVGSHVTKPTWSSDGQAIAFVGVKGRQCEIYTVMRDGSQLRQLTRDGVEKRDPAYSASEDKIYYVERRAGAWRLMQVALGAGSQPQAVPGGEGWRVLHRGHDGRLYGQRADEYVIRVLDSTDSPDVQLTDSDAWTVGPQGIYVRRGRRGNAPAAIWLHPWNGTERKLVDAPRVSGSLAVDPDGAVIFPEDLDHQTDLGLLELRSDS
jgi:Tol biopolymer transport system component